MAKYQEIELERIKWEKSIIDSTPSFNVYKNVDKIFKKVVDEIYHKKIQYSTLNSLPKFHREINEFFIKERKGNRETETCYEFLIFLNKQKLFKIIENNHLNPAILKIMDMRLFWIRDFNSWEKKSKNPEKQLSSLIRHIFCKYDVPQFLNHAWYDTTLKDKNYGNNITKTNKHLDWFIHLGEGKSAKDIKMPFKFTNKMAHSFINTPDDYVIDDAIRRAQVIGIGGNESLAHAINGTFLSANFTNNDFWTTVIEFFVKTPMLNPDIVGPIIDYINNQKYVSTRGYIRPNVWGLHPPPQPKFSMKGRNIQRLIDDTEAWHDGVNESKKGGYVEWKQSSIKPFEYQEGKEGKNLKVYSIKEIVNSEALRKEGQDMRHCVSTYVQSCVKGICSIWSLSFQQFGTKEEKLVTIEIREGFNISQVRGKRNARATKKDMDLIVKWALKENLTIKSFAF